MVRHLQNLYSRPYATSARTPVVGLRFRMRKTGHSTTFLFVFTRLPIRNDPLYYRRYRCCGRLTAVVLFADADGEHDHRQRC